MRDALVKWFLRLYATAMSVAALVWLWRHFPWGLALLATVALFVARAVFKKRRQRQREGSWVEWISPGLLRAGEDDFAVVYHEGGRQHFFYGKAGPPPMRCVLQVPSQAAWPSHVPVWMGERRDLILERIRQNLPAKGLVFEVPSE
jgi:hypothetical protein